MSRKVRRTCGAKATDRFTCNELTDRLGTDDIITLVQTVRTQSRKDENEWVKQGIDHDLEVD